MANATSKVRVLHPQTPGTRLAWSALGLTAVGVLAVARALTPASSGVGTHTQLGLPPCGFLWLTGLPCPGCGLTTSFAHLAHGDWTAAINAHPLGVPLFLLLILAVPVAFFGAIRAWSFATVRQRPFAERAVYLLAAAFGLTWIARLLRIGLG